VEVVTIILLVLALYFLPVDLPEQAGTARHLRDAALALVGGGTVGVAAFAVMTRPHQTIADFFIAQSVPGGGGHNVVNVILV
ncbi:hydrogen gas-evolving membrane-bound hydrogenase subunit E, partial [Acinetobacter baumannii]